MNASPREPVHLRLGSAADLDLFRVMYRNHLEVLAKYNETVDVENPLGADFFEKPGVLFPWLLERNGAAVGFALVGNHRLARAMGCEEDFLLFEYFVCEPERRTGAGREGVALLLAEHTGSWSLSVLPGNRPAMEFWKRMLEPRGGVGRLYRDKEGVEFLRYSVPAQR